MGNLHLKGKLDLDGSGWGRAARKAGEDIEHLNSKQLSGLKESIAEAFTIGAIVEFGHALVENVTHIKDMAEQFGMSTNEVQELQAAALKVGLAFEDVGRAYEKFATFRRAAGEEGEESEKAKLLAKMGFTYADVQTSALGTADAVAKIAQALKGVEMTPAGREDLKQLFGEKAGGKMAAVIEAMQQGAGAHIIDPKDITMIDDLDKQLSLLWSNFKADSTSALAGFMQTSQELLHTIGHFVGLGTKFDPQRGLMGWAKMLNAVMPSWMLGGGLPLNAVAKAVEAKKNPEPAKPEDLFENKAAEKYRKDQEDAEIALAEETRARQYGKLKPLEQELDLRKRIAAELRAAASIENENGGNRTASSVDLRRSANRNQQALDALERAHDVRTPTDSLNRVGNFLGQNVGMIPQVQERLVQAHQATTVALNKVADKLDKVNFGPMGRDAHGMLDSSTVLTGFSL